MSEIIDFPTKPPPTSGDDFDAILDALFEELQELRTSAAVIGAAVMGAANLEGRTAQDAHSVFERSIERLDQVHTKLEEWHLRRLNPPRITRLTCDV